MTILPKNGTFLSYYNSLFSFYEAKAITLLKLDQLKLWLMAKVTSDEEWRAHYLFVVKQVNLLQQNPEEFKSEELLPAPPGMPIGDSDYDFCPSKQ